MIERDEKGRFIKGKSGNPEGRPKKEYTISDILRAKLEEKIKFARSLPDGEKKFEEKLTAEALADMWIDIALKGDPKTIKDIVERLEGKAREHVEHSGNISHTDIDLTKLSTEELEQLERLSNKAQRPDND